MKGGAHLFTLAALSFLDPKRYPFTAGLTSFQSPDGQANVRTYDLPVVLYQMAVVYSVALHGHLLMCTQFLQISFSVVKQKLRGQTKDNVLV